MRQIVRTFSLGILVFFNQFFWLHHLAAIEDKYLNFRSYTTNEGLAHNYVMSIVEDANGYVWIATIDGLSRFDGYDFRNYYSVPFDTNSLSDNIIRKLFVDRKGELWVGTLSGLCRYKANEDRFHQYPFNVNDGTGLNDNEVHDICEDSKGNIWIATFEGGLNKLDPATGQFTYYIHNPSDSSTIAGNSIISVMADRDDNIWIGVKQVGLSVFSAGSQKFMNSLLTEIFPKSSAKFIPKILQDSNGVLWIATGQGLVEVKLKADGLHVQASTVYNPLGESLKTNVITALSFLDSDKLFAAYSINGVYAFDVNTHRFTKYNDLQQPLQSYITNSLMVQKNGTVWIGMKDRGVKIYHPYTSHFSNYRNFPNDPSSLSDDVVISFYFDKVQGFWVGTQNGLNFINQESLKKEEHNFQRYLTDPKQKQLSGLNSINAICKDSYGYFWLGTHHGIVRVGEKELYAAKKFDISWNEQSNVEPTNSVVWSIIEGPNAELWVGTDYGVIRYYNRNAKGIPQSAHRYLTGYDKENQIASNHVKTLAMDERGVVWVGTMEGLCLYSGDGTFKTFLKGYAIRCIAPDAAYLYIGTEGRGLVLYNTLIHSYTIVNISHGLPSNTIWGIIKDDQNNLWLTTNHGLAKYNLKTKEIVTFYKQHGLQDNEFKTGAFLKSDKGQCFIGGVKGFSSFYPDEVLIDTLPPRVHLTGLSIFNHPVSPNEIIENQVVLTSVIEKVNKLNLSYRHKVFSIDFTAVDNLAPELCRFEYILDGFDEGWISADYKNRRATYTNLKKGNYIFKVKAYNSHGVQSLNTIELPVHIQPPVWNTFGFYIMLVVIVFLVIYIVFKLRERNARDKNRKLTYERDLLQLLMDNVPDNIFFKDVNSKFVRVNKGMACFVNEDDPKNLIGKSDFDYFPKFFAETTYDDERKLFATRIPLINKLEHLVLPNGDEVFLMANKVPIIGLNGNIEGLVGISRDITYQKRHEQELEKAKNNAEESDKLKTAFLANMSHEIRTPMNAILGFLSLLDEPETAIDSRKEYMSIIQSNGETLLKLIDDIIDISLIESGQLKLTVRECSLSYLISNLAKEYQQRQQFSGKGRAAFIYTSSLDDKLLIQTDEHRLRQIVVNFLENAFKFTKEGHVELGLEKRNAAIKIFVKDTGIGIARDMHEAVFERFVKIENKKEKLYRGTGLGLFISKRLSEMLGFTLGVESEPSNGATFWVEIPISRFEGAHKTIIQSKPMVMSNYQWDGKCVLLVEDEYSNYLYIEGLLRKTGVRLLHATDGYEAVNNFHAHPEIDLILMDIKLPKMDGIEATKVIRGFNAEVPIIAQTAYAFKSERERILQAGCNEYLPKPITKHKLYELLSKYLDS